MSYGPFVFLVITINAAPPTPNCGTTMQVQKIGSNSYVCLPNACDYDMCDPGLGTCNNGYASVNSTCEYGVSGNYTGITSVSYGVSTEYCSLEDDNSGFPLCESNLGACGVPVNSALLQQYNVTGIAAVNPAIFGLDPNRGSPWGQGCTVTSKWDTFMGSGICYYLEGPGGNLSVMITNRCAGYCNCEGSTDNWYDCGTCDVSPKDPSKIHPNCPCIANDGDMYPSCCGKNDTDAGSVCTMPLEPDCDWCAGNNHAHFDLNTEAFDIICGGEASQGHCVLTQFVPYKCGPTIF